MGSVERLRGMTARAGHAYSIGRSKPSVQYIPCVATAIIRTALMGVVIRTLLGKVRRAKMCLHDAIGISLINKAGLTADRPSTGSLRRVADCEFSLKPMARSVVTSGKQF